MVAQASSYKMALKIFPLNNYTPHYNNISLQQLQRLLIKHKKNSFIFVSSPD